MIMKVDGLSTETETGLNLLRDLTCPGANFTKRLAPEQKYSGASCSAEVPKLLVTICNVAKF